MRKIMNAQKGVGIAAPQVGVSLRCFLVRYEECIYTFVNPTITHYASETSLYEEGCLSIPGVYADVSRPVAVHIDAYDATGKALSLDVDDFFA